MEEFRYKGLEETVEQPERLKRHTTTSSAELSPPQDDTAEDEMTPEVSRDKTGLENIAAPIPVSPKTINLDNDSHIYIEPRIGSGDEKDVEKNPEENNNRHSVVSQLLKDWTPDQQTGEASQPRRWLNLRARFSDSEDERHVGHSSNPAGPRIDENVLIRDRPRRYPSYRSPGVTSKISSESADEWIDPYGEIEPNESASRRESPDPGGAQRTVRRRPEILPPSPGSSINESEIVIRIPPRRPIPRRLSSPPLNRTSFGPRIPRIPYGGYPSYDRLYGPSVPQLRPVSRALSSPPPNPGGSSDESEDEIRRRRTISIDSPPNGPYPNPFAPRTTYGGYPSFDPYFEPSVPPLKPTAYYPYTPNRGEPLSKAYRHFPPAPPPSVNGIKDIPKLSLKCKIGTRPSNGVPVFSEYNFQLRGEFSLKNYIKSIDNRDPVMM
jgi:hypothetical protein